MGSLLPFLLQFFDAFSLTVENLLFELCRVHKDSAFEPTQVFQDLVGALEPIFQRGCTHA